MISVLRGVLYSLDEQRHRVVMDAHGVGYELHVHGRDLPRLHSLLTQEAVLHSYLHVREDAMELFGFLDPAEKYCFIDLISVNGIGPRLGMAILGACSVLELAQAIQIENVALLKSVPGVGPKTAQRIILELKSKVSKWPSSQVSQSLTGHSRATPQPLTEMDDLRSMFANLGYPALSIERVLMECAKQEPFMQLPFEEKVRQMLKSLSLKASATL